MSRKLFPSCALLLLLSLLGGCGSYGKLHLPPVETPADVPPAAHAQ